MVGSNLLGDYNSTPPIRDSRGARAVSTGLVNIATQENAIEKNRIEFT